MAITERERQHLIQRLEVTLGQDAAYTLMDALPPAGDEIATRRDTAALDQKLDVLEQRLVARMHEEFVAQTRWVLTAFVTSLLAFGGLVLAATQLA